MKIAVFGLGYVGCTAAACIASQGHTVFGVDVNETKINDINQGHAPFEEPGLQDLISQAVSAGKLIATENIALALDAADAAIVCVGTPSGIDGAHDMRYIIGVTVQIANELKALPAQKLTVAYRSTMRPGSIRKLISPIFASVLGEDFQSRVELVYNPEFLREAQAIHDYFHPPKVVTGTVDGKPSDVMDRLHHGIEAQVFHTGFEEAEITKFVDNSWHAVKVTFANEIGRTCQSLGVSASEVHKIFVADTKLNISPYYTRPGGAFGGSCLPKDVRALQYIASELGANTHLLDSLLRSNEAHKNFQFTQVKDAVAAPAKILMAGLAFKADTDDLRESPNVDLARRLLSAGYHLRVFDPKLVPSKLRGQNLGYVYTNLPTIDQLLVDKNQAEAETWDLVIASNETYRQLDLPEATPRLSTYSIR